jgi:hypothetical protein
VVVKLLRRLFALTIAAAYFGATVAAAASPVGSCPALEGKGHAAHQHEHGAHQHKADHSHHQQSTPTNAGECLKCCLAACMVASCLPGPTTGVSEHAFTEAPVLYWVVSSAIVGHPVAPDPGPPKPIT